MPVQQQTIECRAVLFDLDGVLVDSMALIERILREWARGHGLDADEAVAFSHGRRDIDVVREIAPHLDAETETRHIVQREEHDFAGLTAMPGAARMLRALPRNGWAVVTSGTRAVALGRLTAAGLPEPAILVAADDIRAGKPHPEGYLTAAARLGVRPSECVVVEDAPAGVNAAHAAGMACIGVGDGLADVAHLLHMRLEGLHQIQAETGTEGLLLLSHLILAS